LCFYDALKKLRANAASYQTDRISQNIYFQALATVYTFNKHFQPEETVILIDSMHQTVPIPKDQSADIFVFSPRWRYLHNRPAWIFELGSRTAVPVKIHQPCIIKAFYKEEINSDKRSIPVDLLTVEKNEDDVCYLALPQGDFTVRCWDLNGNIFKEFDYQVKQ
jgi:hypothetical protein